MIQNFNSLELYKRMEALNVTEFGDYLRAVANGQYINFE